MAQTKKQNNTKITTKTLKVEAEHKGKLFIGIKKYHKLVTNKHTYTQKRERAQKMTVQYTAEKDQERLNKKMVC